MTQQWFTSRKGSSVVSYLTMITIVVMAVIGMRVYMMRWGHSMVRYVSDYLGDQKKSEQDFGNNGGRLESSDAIVNTRSVTRHRENRGQSRLYNYNETRTTTSNQTLNLGPSRQR